MKSVIDKIKESVEAVIGKNRFHYNDGDGLNIDLDNADYPCAFARLVETGALEDSLGQFHERVSIGVFFADVADPCLEPMPNEQILTECKQRALTWLATLRNNDDLTLASLNGTDRVYIKSEDFDVRLTAFVVNVTLEENRGYGLCDVKDCGCGC